MIKKPLSLYSEDSFVLISNAEGSSLLDTIFESFWNLYIILYVI